MFSENVQIALMVRYAYIITRQKISTVLGAGNKQGQVRKAEQGSIFRSIKYQSLLEDSAYCSEESEQESRWLFLEEH